MLISDIRRQNARALAREAGSPADFARKTGMSDSQISQLIGENPTKNIGGIIARRIETAFEKSEGWMDKSHMMGGAEPRKKLEIVEASNIATPEEIIELITLYKDASPGERKMIMKAARLNRRRKLPLAVDR